VGVEALTKFAGQNHSASVPGHHGVAMECLYMPVGRGGNDRVGTSLLDSDDAGDDGSRSSNAMKLRRRPRGLAAGLGLITALAIRMFRRPGCATTGVMCFLVRRGHFGRAAGAHAGLFAAETSTAKISGGCPVSMLIG